jgi:hypothetical protein
LMKRLLALHAFGSQTAEQSVKGFLTPVPLIRNAFRQPR